MGRTTRRPSAVVPTGRSPESRAGTPTTDDAWRTLLLIVEWIKHAETKAAATMASVGVLGGLLYTLVSRVERPSVAFTVAASIAAGAIVVSGLGAGIALRPRIRSAGALPGLLFYRSIAKRFADDADAYMCAFIDLVGDRPALLTALSSQIWDNADVARRKYRAVSVAVTALLTALAAVAVTAALGLLGAD